MIELAIAALGWTIVYRAGEIANGMNGHTSHLPRLAVVALAAGALGVGLSPLYGVGLEDWVVCLFAFGVACWLWVDRRTA